MRPGRLEANGPEPTQEVTAETERAHGDRRSPGLRQEMEEKSG